MTTSTTAYDQLFLFFGLSENPFNVSPDPRFYFSTPAHAAALAELQFAIHSRHGLMLLSGEAGTGKTTLIHHLLDQLRGEGKSTSYVFHSRLDADELFEFILRDFGVSCASRRKGDLLAALHNWLIQRHRAGDCPVVIIDEAQGLSAATLDELRLLLNLEAPTGKLVQIVLAGQSELEEKLRRPELRQLRQRVMFRCRLPLLALQETSEYIQSRLIRAGAGDPALFSEEAVAAIHNYSRGIPRTINLVCEHALINAYAGHKRVITPEDILYIASDFDLVENPLSLGEANHPAEAAPSRLLPFPLPHSAPGSLSALRLAFVSASQRAVSAAAASTAAAPAHSAAQPRPSLVHEQTLPLQAMTPPMSEPLFGKAAGGAVQGEAQVAITADSFSLELSPAKPVQHPTNGHRPDSRLASYWSGVTHSFRRDVRDFRAAWIQALRGNSRSGSSPTH